MRLLAVELNRFRSRRAIVLLVLAAAVLAIVLAGVTAWKTRPLSHTDRTDAIAQAELQGKKSGIQEEVRACQAEPQEFLGPNATASQCESTLVPGPSAYYPRHALSLRHTLSTAGLGLPLALVVAALMVIAGCTFAGADWASGSLTNQLLFEPRRSRVWLAKAGAVTIGAGLVALVVVTAFWLIVGSVAEARSIDVTTAQVTHVVWHVLRATALAMAAALGAYALTMVFRHTVATLALLFVYSIGGEIVLNLVPFDGAGRISLGTNSLGWLATRYHYFDATNDCAPGHHCGSTQVMSHLESSLFLGGLLVVAVVVSLLWFRRRDV